jgi:hypothetical protein
VLVAYAFEIHASPSKRQIRYVPIPLLDAVFEIGVVNFFRGSRESLSDIVTRDECTIRIITLRRVRHTRLGQNSLDVSRVA